MLKLNIDAKELFIKKYKAITDVECDLYMARASIPMVINGNYDPSVAEELAKQELTLQVKAKSLEKELITTSQALSPKNAIDIIRMTQVDGHFYDINGVDGQRAYHYLNQGLKNNPEVALEAFKRNSNVSDFFPEALKNRIGNESPAVALPKFVEVNKKQNDVSVKSLPLSKDERIEIAKNTQKEIEEMNNIQIKVPRGISFGR
jgi:hypothetical protein